MKVQQIYTACIAEAAYYIESEGEAAIIDPLRETEPYTEMAEKRGSKIKYIFETHFHADFVSGHVDLARKTGAEIVYGPTAEAGYQITVAEDNQEFSIGKIKVRVLHTPGHTMESSTFLLIDENGEHQAIFTGDTLFLGDVGRPDLAVKTDLTEKDLAGMLYDSLRNKIMPLSDDLIIYPGHGAGSSCGKNLSSDTVDTLGHQKEVNYALNPKLSKEEFIAQVTEGILPPPQYFPKNAMMNKNGYESIDTVMERGVQALDAQGVRAAVDRGAMVLDVRNKDEFRAGHIPGAVFIGLDGNFAMWVGAVLNDINQDIVLVAPEGRESEAVKRLARVGYDHAVGYLKGGVAAWDGDLSTVETVSAEAFAELRNESIPVLDVRKPGEYDAEHLVGATHYPLDYINDHLEDLEKGTPYYMHCKSGYRSLVAWSILTRNGYEGLKDIAGGFMAMKGTPLQVTDFVCPSTLA